MICAVCGTEFANSQPNAKVCGAVCRKTYQREYFRAWDQRPERRTLRRERNKKYADYRRRWRKDKRSNDPIWRSKECARRQRYRKQNPEKTKLARREYREKNRDTWRAAKRRRYAQNPEKHREKLYLRRSKNPEKHKKYMRERGRKIADLIAVLRREMPELLKEFGL